ncbi:MAG: BamA/TamA family outer membrane protein [Holophagaceae bacterium]|nr:BamA/TamA family outer membrane protein [Holophagaceae bacterium]
MCIVAGSGFAQDISDSNVPLPKPPVLQETTYALQGFVSTSIVKDILFAQVEGLTEDDRILARLAFGFRDGVDQLIDSERLSMGLKAIDATDRFRIVDGSIVGHEGKNVLFLTIVPWPKLKSINIVVPAELKKRVQPWLQDIRKGTRIGNYAIDAWERRAESWLDAWGYPNSRAEIVRTKNGESIEVRITVRQTNLINKLEISSDSNFGLLDPKSIQNELDKLLKSLVEKQKNWPSEVQRNIVNRLNRRFAKKGHFYAKAIFSRENSEKLSIEINAGPVVRLGVTGTKMRKGQLKKILNLPSVDRFGEDLLEEARRRLAGKYHDEGRPFTKVMRSETDLNSINGIVQKHLVYNFKEADLLRVSKTVLTEKDGHKPTKLLAEAKNEIDNYFSGSHKATTEFASLSKTLAENHYIIKGYPDKQIFTEWGEVNKGRTELNISAIEGEYQELKEINIVIDVSEHRDEILKEVLKFFDEKISKNAGVSQFDFQPTQKNWIIGPIQWSQEDNVTYLKMLTPNPFVPIHIAELVSVIRQALASEGAVSPRVDAKPVDMENSGKKVIITVPEQQFEQLRRIVIQGAENTRAEFIRGIMRPPDSQTTDQERMWFGRPLVLSRITATRAELGSFGIFRSVDVVTLREALDGSDPSRWQPGDMMFRLSERPVWNFSNSFSYDRSVGYQFGLGAQKINMLGKARTMDFNIRAGDGTINSSTLRRIFSTGDPSRSLDTYSMGYTDPWLPTGIVGKRLGNRALWRGEVAFIKERQNVYLIFHRRYTTSLEWHLRDKKNDHRTFRFGYRFENVGVNGPDASEMQDQVRSPNRSILSIPFIQFVRDTRDNPFDPRRGSIAVIQFDVALQTLGTSANSSFIKADLRYAWNYPIGLGAKYGVLSLATRLGAARPTASSSLEMPLSERFFGGGPNSHRGIEPDQLGPFSAIFEREKTFPYNPITDDEGSQRYRMAPIGGQGIAIVNLDYRFPLPVIGEWIWGELFVDSGEVYNRIREVSQSSSFLSPFPHWRTSAGTGLILRLGGFPIKMEYAWDVRQVLGKTDGDIYTNYTKRTRLTNFLVSAGIQF